MILAVILGEFLTKRKETGTRTIFKNAPVNKFQRIKSLLRSRQVRLTDIKMIYFYSSGLRIIGQRSEFSDR